MGCCVVVVGYYECVAVSFSLPELTALHALMSVFASRVVVGVYESSDWSGDGSASLFIVVVCGG